MELLRRTRTVELHQAQLDFRGSPALYRAFIGGRGSGKSYVGALDMLLRAWQTRGTYLVASPTGVLMQDTTFPTLKTLALDLGLWGECRVSPYPTVTLRSGSTIRFRTAEDPEKLRGPNISGAWLDEGSLMARAAYEIVIACLREYGRQGWLTLTATPKGLTHWTYEVFGGETPRPDTALFHCRTADNPFLPRTFADTLAKQYVGHYARQELDGEFCQIDGAEFLAEWFGPGIWFDRWPHANETLLRVIALDPSKGKDARVGQEGQGGDYSAFVILYLAKDGTIYVDADMDNRRPLPAIVAAGIELYRQHKPDAFACEINQFQELLAKDFLREAQKHKPPLILPMWGWDNRVNKEVRIRRLAPILAGVDGRIRFKAGSRGATLLVNQLRDFRAPPHPPGYHDDGPDALEMAVRMLLHLMAGNKAPHADSGGPKPMG